MDCFSDSLDDCWFENGQVNDFEPRSLELEESVPPQKADSDVTKKAKALTEKLHKISKLNMVKKQRMDVLKDIELTLKIKDAIENSDDTHPCPITVGLSVYFFSDSKFVLSMKLTNNSESSLNEGWKFKICWHSIDLPNCTNNLGSTFFHKSVNLPVLESQVSHELTFYCNEIEDTSQLPISVQSSLVKTFDIEDGLDQKQLFIRLPTKLITILDLVRTLKESNFVPMHFSANSNRNRSESSWSFSVKPHFVNLICLGCEPVPHKLLKFLFPNLTLPPDISKLSFDNLSICGQPGILKMNVNHDTGKDVITIEMKTNCIPGESDWLEIIKKMVLLKLMISMQTINNGPSTTSFDREILKKILSDYNLDKASYNIDEHLFTCLHFA